MGAEGGVEAGAHLERPHLVVDAVHRRVIDGRYRQVDEWNLVDGAATVHPAGDERDGRVVRQHRRAHTRSGAAIDVEAARRSVQRGEVFRADAAVQQRPQPVLQADIVERPVAETGDRVDAPDHLLPLLHVAADAVGVVRRIVALSGGDT